MTIKRLTIFYCLVLSTALLTACVARPIVANAAGSSPAKMPKPLLGVWHENSVEGRRQCERYRRLGPKQQPVDEAADPLVGAVVITDQMVHTYSEYGEGDFFSIQNVQLLSRGEWRVRSLVYIDTMPTDDQLGSESIDRFSLHKGTLRWTRDDQSDHERAKLSGFFRCGPVRKASRALSDNASATLL
jgi:hypothetical protein